MTNGSGPHPKQGGKEKAPSRKGRGKAKGPGEKLAGAPAKGRRRSIPPSK